MAHEKEEFRQIGQAQEMNLKSESNIQIIQQPF